MTGSEAPPRPAQQVERACHDPFRAALERIETRLSSGILGALRRGHEGHHALITEVGLRDAAPDAWDVRAERLLDYRRRLSAEILNPMLVAFRGSPGPVSAIAVALDEALAEAMEAARNLPAEVDDTWADDALRPDPSDGLVRRFGKFFARGFSSARKAGRPRSVPVRAVALHHLGATLAAEIDATTTGSMEEWTDWARKIELAWIEWGETALPALVRSELPDEEVEGETAETDPWSAVRDAAERLDGRFTGLVEKCPLHAFTERIRDRLVHAAAIVEAELTIAGSFLFDPENTHRIVPKLRHLDQLAPALEAWDAGVANRLRLYEALLAILSGATAVQRRLIWRVREERLSDIDVLPEVAVKLERMAEELRARGQAASSLPDRLRRLDTEVADTLKPTESAIPDPDAVDRTIQVGSDATVDALLSMVRQAPVSLELHSEDGRLPHGARKVETRTLAFQDLARQAFDAMRIERIRSSTAGLVGSIDEVRSDIAELPNVFAFAFEAALGELANGDDDADERATGLVSEALASMAESLHNAERSLDAAARRAQGRLATEVSDGSLGLLDRISAGRMQAGLFAARSSFAELRAWINERWGPPVEAAGRAVTARYRVFRRWASRGLRKGTEIVGTGPGTGAASARTLRRLSEAETILKELPLVYQRLFSFDPISDPSLLAAREGELADGLNRWERWQAADGVPLIISGRPGSGVTSFMNVLGIKIAEGGVDHRHVSLDERVDGEERLATLLARALDLDEALSLDDLSSVVFDAPAGTVPDAITIDNLEHLYLRVPKGTDVIERLLTLMAETEPRIFWMGGITSSAWQLVETAEPTAISQVDVVELDQLAESGIREAVLLRHRRSGLPLRFEEPAVGRRMLRRRLRRLRDREGYDDLLADDFFDRLQKTSSRNLRLAFFQWLVSADFGQGEGVVLRPPERPDFSVLEALGITQNFTLKAFLEHRTLTLAEHDRVFRVQRQESYQIFESLQNRHLIEPVVTSDGEDQPTRSEIQEDLRYRVTPLLAGAVITHLRSRNIFH